MPEMTERMRTVGEVADLVGVSVRTLHHYDRVGLVMPSARSAAGYRMYSTADVERLHHVLVYRELDFPLDRIAELLDDPAADQIGLLRRQQALLTDRIEHLRQVVDSLERMVAAKTMGIQLSDEEQREIFGQNWLGSEYAEEAERRWGETDAWQQSQRRSATFDKAQWQRIKDDGDALLADLAAALRAGVEPGTEPANALAERHRASIEVFYDCDHAMQSCLAQMYVDDARFTAYYDGAAPGLAGYLKSIIDANADGRRT
jgi:DNA-binding transcriptional MerR regulator